MKSILLKNPAADLSGIRKWLAEFAAATHQPYEQRYNQILAEINNRLADAFVATVGEPWISPPYNWGPIYSFVRFDFTWIAKLKIHAPDRSMTGVVIRPALLNIKPGIIDQNTIAFSIAKPCILYGFWVRPGIDGITFR